MGKRSSYSDRLAAFRSMREPSGKSRHKPRRSSSPAALPSSGPLAAAARKHPMHVQTLLFSRDDHWTVPRAKSWAKSHGYKSGKVDVTDRYIRLRQEPPGRTKIKRTITFGSGIRAVVGRAETSSSTRKEAMAGKRRSKRSKKSTTKRRRKARAAAPAAAAPRRHRRRRARAAAPAAAAPRRRRRPRAKTWHGHRKGHQTAARKGHRRRRRAAPRRRRARATAMEMYSP